MLLRRDKKIKMKKIKAYLAASLNGKISRADGNVDWLDALPNPDMLDYGYFEFYDSIDTTIQGYNTYQLVMGWNIDFPYKAKKNYVLTRKQGLDQNEHVEFISENHIAFLKELKNQEGKDIWLIGGGQVNTMLLNENLIDEIIIHVMPIILPDGIELFELIPKETFLKLINSKSYPTGVVELVYQIEN